MEWQFCLNWQAIIEEAKQRRKSQKLTQQRLALLAEVSTPTVIRFESGEQRIELCSALNILSALGMLDERQLTFPKEYDDECGEATKYRKVVFWGKDGEKEIQCAISFDALDDFFNADKQNKLKAFRANQAAIEHEARRKYLAGLVEQDHSILIRSSDLN